MQFTSVSAEVAALTEAAAALAGEPSLCPGGMAAVSVKTADGGVVLTAARPGRPVDRLGLRTGWAALDAAAIAAVRDSELLAALPTARQTDTVADLLAAAVRLAAEDDPDPPGCDAWLLHALPARWVLHLHPPAIDALVCAEDFAVQAGLLKPRGPQPAMFVGYAAPGLPLALRVAGDWAAYREEHGAGPAVVLLQNDGLLLAGDDWRPLLEEARDLAAQAAEITGLGARAAVRPRPAGIARDDEEMLAARVMDLRRVLFDLRESRSLIRTARAPDFLPRLPAGENGDRLPLGALDPAVAEHCNCDPFLMDGSVFGAADARLEKWHDNHLRTWPKVALLGGEYYAVIGDGPDDCRITDVMFRSALAALVGCHGAGGRPHRLPESEVSVLRTRRALAARPARQVVNGRTTPDPDAGLHNTIVCVAGPGPGLGDRIAATFADAGALVFRLQEVPTNPAEKAAADRPHTAVVDWEVEDGIAAALRRCVLEFGGLDVLVWCAPTVPAHPLGELTGETWHGVIRGLTGYVNCARSAARIFTHQKMGGQILYVEPPDDGEIRRTAAAAMSGAAAAMNRAWSQEFADGGIRVNALAHVADDTPDAADLLRFLAGGHSRALNGQTLQCAG